MALICPECWEVDHEEDCPRKPAADRRRRERETKLLRDQAAMRNDKQGRYRDCDEETMRCKKCDYPWDYDDSHLQTGLCCFS